MTRTANPEPVEEVPFDDFLDRFVWRQGEHLSLIGPTGRGKTTLARHLLPMRDWVTVVATKPMDPLVESMRDDGYTIIREWPKHLDKELARRLVLWPRYTTAEDAKTQQRVIHRALTEMFAARGWTIYLDELAYIANQLKLRSATEMLWQQGRSVGITVVAGTQRPAHVPLFMYDQATHLFLFQDRDEVNLKRMAGMGGADSKRVRHAVQNLPSRHHVLYVNGGSGGMVVTLPHQLD